LYRTIASTARDDEFSVRDRLIAVAEQRPKKGQPDFKLNGELHRDERPSL
jgi:hypothetical protein